VARLRELVLAREANMVVFFADEALGKPSTG
jgi:hypothetical protein